MGARLTALKADGLAISVGLIDDYLAWQLLQNR
jgi:hypothetical protein